MYEEFYKLTGKPFQLNPAPGFYFASRGHERAFAYLKYGVYEGEGFLVVTGEIGAGKTTLVQALVSELDPTQIVAAQLVTTQFGAADLVRAVAGAFGLRVEDRNKAQLLVDFETFLAGVAEQGRRALLIVDEAQNLSVEAVEELRMLSNFQRGSRVLLQTFLVGQPELRDVLTRPAMTQLRQRIIASYHLGPMDRDDARAYVLHRLGCVGWNGDPRIEESIFDGLYAATGGLPRLINSLCNRLFLNAYLAKSHTIGAADFAEMKRALQDEIGPGSPPESASPGRATSTPSSRSTSAGLAAPMVSSSITARLDRIEKSVSQAIDLLQTISADAQKVAPGAAGAAPGDARPRYRFGGRV